MIDSLVIIPARMQSTRLPGKPLIEVCGMSIVQRVYSQSIQSKAHRTIVATPDDEIVKHCEDRNIECVQTTKEHATGTHRCFEAFQSLHMPDQFHFYGVIINLQCDLPGIPPEYINKVIEKAGRFSIATLVSPFESEEEFHNTSNVKVVCSRDRCHWFSRSAMAGAWHHIGVYGFSHYAISRVGRLPLLDESYAAKERLEQLIWIESGEEIMPIHVEKSVISIDTQNDLGRFKEELSW